MALSRAKLRVSTELGRSYIPTCTYSLQGEIAFWDHSVLSRVVTFQVDVLLASQKESNVVQYVPHTGTGTVVDAQE